MIVEKQEYRRIVERLLHDTDQKTLPINISKIAQSLGIEVLKMSMPKPEVSGFIVKREDGQICIYVNENDAITRQRFTIAHELAHFYLHYKDEDNVDDKKVILDFVKFRNGKYDYEGKEEERQANAFAAELLVPFYFLKEIWDDGYRDGHVVFLADLFAVSIEMMEHRLNNCRIDLEKAVR